jgi:predicted small secreted protein
MSAIRNSRTRLVGAATVVLAALSLTACNDGTGVNDEGAGGASASVSASAGTFGSKRPLAGVSAPTSAPQHGANAGSKPVTSHVPQPVAGDGSNASTASSASSTSSTSSARTACTASSVPAASRDLFAVHPAPPPCTCRASAASVVDRG